jgi:hypothetical protein
MKYMSILYEYSPGAGECKVSNDYVSNRIYGGMILSPSFGAHFS